MTAVLDKWKIFNHEMPDAEGNPKKIWAPHRGQMPIATDAHRHQVVACGRRFGKSNIGGNKLVPEAFYTKPIANQLKMDGKRRIFWIVGPEYSDAEKEFRVIWDQLTKLQVPMDKPGSYDSLSNMTISLWDGAMLIDTQSAKYPQNLVGEGLSGVILSEAAKLKENIWTKYIRPTLADFTGWSYSSSTPEGKNWFYDLWRLGQDPNNPEWKSWRMPAWINNHVYKTPTNSAHVMFLLDLERQFPNRSVFELQKMYDLIIDHEIMQSINELTVEAFMQEMAADFTEFVGRVFKDFDEETHVTDLEFHPGWQTVGAVDYGFTDPNVWLLIQIGPWGEINVLDEIYEHGLDPTEFADLIRERQLNPPGLHFFYPDPAAPGDTRVLEKKLGIKGRSSTGGELAIRLNHIRKALRTRRTVIEENIWLDTGEGLQAQSIRPQLMFDRRCSNTIKDMLNYKYPEKKDDITTNQTQKPLKKNDHGPEALGRMFAGIFGQYSIPQQTTIHKANVGRHRTGAPTPQDFTYAPDEKELAFRRPAMHEKEHRPFPRVNMGGKSQ